MEALQRKQRKYQSLKSVADQIAFVQRMHQNKAYGKWIKHVNWNTKRKPYVILYQEEFLKDITQLSKGQKPVILGVDKTYELSAAFGTILTYRQHNLTNEDSKEKKNPLLIGAVMLHFDSSTETFQSFFNHLRYEMGVAEEDLDINAFEISGGPLFSSDQEASLCKAIKNVWPNSTLVYCARHLQDNLERQLKKMNVTNKVRSDLVKAIFQEGTGLIYCDEVEFLEKKTQIQDQFYDIYQRSTYLKKFLLKVKQNVLDPRWQFTHLSLSHKNNDSECMNNIIKMKTLRKCLKVPQLIEVFIRIFVMQEKLIKMALQGQGKYSLKPWMSHVACSYDQWITMSDEDQEAKFQKFFKGPKTRPETLESNDHSVVMPNVDTKARKKGSKKKHSNKTTSIKLKRKSTISPKKTKKATKTRKRVKKTSSEESDYETSQATTHVTTPAAKKRILQSSEEDNFSQEISRKPTEDSDNSDLEDWLREKKGEEERKGFFDTIGSSSENEGPGQSDLEEAEAPKTPRVGTKRQLKDPAWMKEYYCSSQKADKKKGKKNSTSQQLG